MFDAFFVNLCSLLVQLVIRLDLSQDAVTFSTVSWRIGWLEDVMPPLPMISRVGSSLRREIGQAK